MAQASHESRPSPAYLVDGRDSGLGHAALTATASRPHLRPDTRRHQAVPVVAAPRPGPGAVPAIGVAPAQWATWLLPAVDGTAVLTAALVAGVAWPFAAGYSGVVLITLGCAGLYRIRICLRLGDELPRLVAGTLGSLLVLALLRVPVLPLALLATGAVFAGRTCHYHLVRTGRRRGLVREPALVVGGDPTGVQVAEVLMAHPELGLSPCGFLDAKAPVGDSGLPLLGDVTALPDVVATHRIRRIIVCFPDAPDGVLIQALRGLPIHARTDICVVTRLSTLGMRVPVSLLDEIWGIPVVPLRRAGWAGHAVKRAVDLILGGLLLVVLAPVIAGLVVAVRLGSAVPALFRQDRITASGRTVAMLKLRTIAGDHDGDTRWAVDPGRYLRFGGFLRATHLDELPQLVNVVRGDMSLVGPRPERPYFAELFAERIADYDDRHRVRAGITGWAQVNGLHGNTSIEERVRFDQQYIEYWSLWRDLVILIRTLPRLLSGRKGSL